MDCRRAHRLWGDAGVGDFRETVCSMRLSEREETVTVLVQDPRGSTGAMLFLGCGADKAPVINLLAPLASGRYYSSLGVEVVAEVSDSEDLAADLVEWTLQNASLETPAESVDLPPDADGRVGGFLDLEEGIWNIGRVGDGHHRQDDVDEVQITVGGPNRSPSVVGQSG